MALTDKLSRGLLDEGSLLIDSILSQEEMKDVVSMMIMADEYVNTGRTPSFCTSSQMGGRDLMRRPKSPPLSPLSLSLPKVVTPDTMRSSSLSGNTEKEDEVVRGNGVQVNTMIQTLNLKNSFDFLATPSIEEDCLGNALVCNMPNHEARAATCKTQESYVAK